jgi:hypothetical protein
MARNRNRRSSRRTSRRGYEETRRRRSSIVIAAIAVAFLGGFIALVLIDRGQRAARTPPEGVETFEVASGEHVPVWQNCGFYEEPVRSENAVHSLEHGAVWITYRPDLPQEQVERLRELASNESFVLASPYPDLPAPVVASAWGKQLMLDSADDPRLERFVSAFQQGPQTPEPGAVCTGGVGEPAS